MVQLNESQVATPNNLIYDSELPVEYGTVTLAISPSADGKIEKGQVIESFASRIHGRYPVNDILDPETGEVLIPNTKMMMEEDE